MNLNIILSWSITILGFVGLVVFFRIKNKISNKKNLAPLATFAKSYNSTISDYDIWDKTLIGIDNRTINRLFFIRRLPNGEIHQVIDISDVSGCRMSKLERKIKINDKIENVVDKIEVILTFNNNTPDLALEFYNTDYDRLVLTGELQLAQKWLKTINIIVSNNQNLKVMKLDKTKAGHVIDWPIKGKDEFPGRKRA